MIKIFQSIKYMIDKNQIERNAHQKISETDSYTKERYMSFLTHFSTDQLSILDFGCNTGRGGEVLKEKNPNLTLYGADIIKERLQKIPINIYEKIFDLSEINLNDTNILLDAIVSGEVVEHIPFEILVEYLIVFKRLLKSNGKLILTTPNPNSFLVRLGRDGVIKDPSHINLMNYKFLLEVLLKLGYKNCKLVGSGKATRFVGRNFPLMGVYGSYMIIASV